MTKCITVGVLALQGAFIEHINHFQKACKNSSDYRFVEVRTKDELDQSDALVIPGGESTAIALIAERTGLLGPLMEYLKDELKPVWGTCAGLIFLSKEIINGKDGQKILGGMDIRVRRNAFGRQLDSFEEELDFSLFITGVTAFPTVFIRAPVVEKVLGSGKNLTSSEKVIVSDNDYQNPGEVEILHQLENGLIVAARQGNKLGTSFHPELSDDYRFHQWVLEEFFKQ